MTKSKEPCQVQRPREHAAADATCVLLSPANSFLFSTRIVQQWVLWNQGEAQGLKEKGGKEERFLANVEARAQQLPPLPLCQQQSGIRPCPAAPTSEMFWPAIKSSVEHLPSTAVPRTQYTTCQLAAERKEAY